MIRELLDSHEGDTQVVTKDDMKGFMSKMIFKTARAINKNQPRMTVEFNVRDGDRLKYVWGFIVDVGELTGGGRHRDGAV